MFENDFGKHAVHLTFVSQQFTLTVQVRTESTFELKSHAVFIYEFLN